MLPTDVMDGPARVRMEPEVPAPDPVPPVGNPDPQPGDPKPRTPPPDDEGRGVVPVELPGKPHAPERAGHGGRPARPGTNRG